MDVALLVAELPEAYRAFGPLIERLAYSADLLLAVSIRMASICRI